MLSRSLEALAVLAGLVVLSSCATLLGHPGSRDPESRWTDVRGMTVHYLDTSGAGRARIAREGAPQSETVLIVHGFASYSHPFRAVVDGFPNEVRVIAPDLPGHGLSTIPRREYTMDYLVESLHAFVASLGLRSFVLCGSSMGANIAIHYAARYGEQVDGLVLLSPVGLTGQVGVVDRFARSRLLLRIGSSLVGRDLIRQIVTWAANGNSAIVTEELIDTYALSVSTRERRMGLASVIRRIICGSHVDDLLPQLVQPTLIISGGEDPLVSADDLERFRRLLPNERVVIFPHGSHLLHQERPVEIAAQITEFARTPAVCRGR